MICFIVCYFSLTCVGVGVGVERVELLTFLVEGIYFDYVSLHENGQLDIL